MAISGRRCEVTISSPTSADNGTWDFQVSSAKFLRQFGNKAYTKHYVYSVTVEGNKMSAVIDLQNYT